MPRISRATRPATALLLAASLTAVGCSTGERPSRERSIAFSDARGMERAELVTETELQRITGVAVTDDGRLFVNAPRWAETHDASVYEVKGSAFRVWPNRWMNRWEPNGGQDPAERFICVQSVTADDQGHLWVLDPAAPSFQGPVPGGPKLIRFSLAGDDVVRTYRFDRSIAPGGSYLNDVRVDTRDNTAFITDSGLGALIVVHLDSGRSYRLLADHPSTKSDPEFVPVIGGARWIRGNAVPQVHADGIAIEREGDGSEGWVYWQALTNNRLYRLPMSALKQDPPDEQAVIEAIEDLGETVVTDGMEIDSAGNLYFSALERDAVVVRFPTGELRTLAQGPELSWPDSFAWGPDGWLYVTTARIHEGDLPRGPFGVWRIRPAAPRP
ncbi:MAG: L-dopachrome tautomerase-related protein [Planctomycetota bacterium]